MPGPNRSARRHRPATNRRPTVDARSAALTLLERLDTEKATLDALLDDDGAAREALSPRDRALFNQLVFGVLRWRLRLDAVIGAHADRSVAKISPTVLNILRLGMFQILFMDRIPPSASVNTAVDLAHRHGAGRAAGFINALLRNHLRDPDRFRLPDAHGSPVDHLALSRSIPHWLAARWIERLGVDEAGRLGDAINTIPPITLRCNRLKTGPADLMTALNGEADAFAPVDGLPDAIHLRSPRQPIHRMRAFVEGRFAVQDAAAQLVSLMLDPRPGETVLDACAGVGGKTMHLAQLMQNQGVLIAVDNLPGKLNRLDREARRLGATIVKNRCLDLCGAISPDDLPRCDRILLDAPCSGLGVLRRNPDARWSAHKRDVQRFADRQIRLLDRLAPLLTTGGYVVFSVCSMEPEENERVVEGFLKNHSDFAICGRESMATAGVYPFLDTNGFLRTFPHIHDMDGFFAARLMRTR